MFSAPIQAMRDILENAAVSVHDHGLGSTGSLSTPELRHYGVDATERLARREVLQRLLPENIGWIEAPVVRKIRASR